MDNKIVEEVGMLVKFDKIAICICIIVLISVAGCVNSHPVQTWHSGSTSTVQIPNNAYYTYTVDMKAGNMEKISIATDGNPIDLMIMDPLNFGTYAAIENTNGLGTWQSWNELSI